MIDDSFEIIQKYHFASYVAHAIKKEDIHMKLSGTAEQAELSYIPNTPYSGAFESFSESGGNLTISSNEKRSTLADKSSRHLRSMQN